ncbi:DUF397 domain-containing protein [Streptomyces melanogenes]|uniref:DUF397 domain-containing protein n=1 Tax=Streptomyces melanogenes TaxID=67326 RepID=UPI00167DE3BB|nr:DUF397 domain-containing protein [Streptomyces melanogenes]GGP67652.1 hypothetical protein GCM10010278_51470 [Streptomyces melanogenes]
MSTTTCPDTDDGWFKSSYSNGSGGECVEAAFLPLGTTIRDSKHPTGPRLQFSAPSWDAFVTALRADRMPAA